MQCLSQLGPQLKQLIDLVGALEHAPGLQAVGRTINGLRRGSRQVLSNFLRH